MTRYASLDALRRAIAGGDVQIVTDGTLHNGAEPYTTPTPAAQQVAQVGVRRITLDYPPSSNRYWRVVNDRVLRSREATAYIEHVALICSTAGIRPLDGELSVTLRVYRPQRSGDLDNRIKCVLDAMQGHFYHNDSQIVAIHATRHDDKECPRIEVEVTQL